MSDEPSKPKGRSAAADSPDSYKNRLTSLSETGKAAHTRIVKEGRSDIYVARVQELATKEGMSFDDARMQAAEEMPPLPPEEVAKNLVERAFTDEDFILKCRDSLNRKMKKGKKASIEDELAWIAENLYRSCPQTERAPSYQSLAWILALKRDMMGLASKSEMRIWELYMTKRMSPGDKRPSKDKAFGDEDATAETEDAADDREAEAMKRLGYTDEA